MSQEKNTGKAYESLTDSVIRGLSKFRGLKNSKTKKNASLDAITCNVDGKPFLHEIDLVWDFELDGMQHRTVFQAKDWNYKVDRPTLMTFCGVLSDLPGNPHGIIITKTGFDSTLIPYAKARGIGLYILDKLADHDFVSCVPSVEIRVDQAQNGYRLALLQTFHPTNADGSYKEKDVKRASNAALALTKIDSDRVFLRNSEDELVGTLAALLQEIYGLAKADGLTLFPVCYHHRLNLEKPLYICTSDTDYRRVQLGGVGCEIEKFPIGETIVISSTLSHILQFCTDDDQYYVDTDFVIHRAGEPFTKLIEIEIGPEGAKRPFFVGFSIPINSSEKPEKSKKQFSRERKGADLPPKSKKRRKTNGI